MMNDGVCKRQIHHARRAGAPEAPVPRIAGANLRDRAPAAERRHRQRQRQREAGHLHDQLHHVDPRGRQKAAGGEVDGDDQRRRSRSRSTAGMCATVSRIDPIATKLSGEDENRSDPEQRRDNAADGRVVSELEVVADRAEVVRGGDLPHRRPDPEREHDRSDRRRSDPPPRGDPAAVADGRGADRRSRADVRGEHRREDQPWSELAPRDEEIARARDVACQGTGRAPSARASSRRGR